MNATQKNILIVLIVVAVGFGVWYGMTAQKSQEVEIDGAFLEIRPAEGTYTVGDTWTAEVWLNTKGVVTDGVDVVMNYDPAVIDVLGDTINFDGGVFTIIPLNIVDHERGEIRFSAITSPQEQFTGEGMVGTIGFTGIAKGSASVTFVFEKGVTTDTNVASVGEDILDGVKNAIFTVR